MTQFSLHYRLQVYVKIFRDDELIKNTVEKPVAILRNTIPNITVIPNKDLAIPVNAVKGIVATPKGRGIPNLIVRAYNKTSRAEVFLSEGITNDRGAYLIYYGLNGDEIRRKAANTDLLVKAYKSFKETAPVITSPLIINALPHEIINLSVGEGTYKGLDTYTSFHEKLEELIDRTTLNDLSEREVFIMANALDLDTEEVSHYIQARQWNAQRDGLESEIYFAWFRCGLPNNWPALINIPVARLTAALEEAIEKNYIPDTTELMQENLEKLITQWRTDHIITAKGTRIEKGSIGDLLGASRLNENQRKQLLDDWQNFEGGVDEFWTRQQTNLGDENYKDLELTLQLGAVTRNHLPLIQSVKNKSRINRVQDIAAIKEEDWLRLMEEEKLEVPEDIPGEDLQSKRKEFASQLRSITEELVPTAVLAHSFKTDYDINSDTLDRFMERNPDFEFRDKTVKTFLKENPEALGDVANKVAAQKELEAVQRVFHLTPTKDKYKGAKLLWQNGLHSAYAIKMSGLSSLQQLFNGDEELAERIYNNASMKQSQASMVKMQIHSLSTSAYALSPVISGLMQQMDNAADLEALFGDQGYCKCKHCDSFFSPSAYLVDLFLYLNKVKVSSNDASDQDTALEKLFKRRPDMGNIQLDCENSHTPLPYIDLVNEVMEMAIVPVSYQNSQVNIYGKMFTLPVAKVPQTETDDASLKAYPQHIKQVAYDLLQGENGQTKGFPWILPFNLWMLEVRTYLNHLGVPRAELMASILGGGINNENIAAEYLNILPEELAIFNEITADASTTQRYWGTDKNQLEKVPVFLKQSGYSYEKLVELLSMRYIQPVSNIIFQPISSCLVSDATIPDLTEEALSRMHKFGRLLHKTNDDMHALDRTIMAFSGEISNAFLVNYANLLKVEKLVKKIDRKELLSWWTPIESTDYENYPSLYARLFMMPEKIAAFELNDSKDELLNPGVILDPLAPPLDPDLLAPILSATNLNAKDLELLVTEEFPNQVIRLDLSQISYLYRTTSFCRAMKIKVSGYLALKNVLGFAPVSGISETVNPVQTLAFINMYYTIKNAGFDAEEINYILRHQVRANAPFGIAETEIEKILKKLHALIQTQLKEVFPAGTTTKEIVDTKLKLIIGTNDAEAIARVTSVENVIEGTSSLSVAEQEALIDNEMAFFHNKQEAKSQLIAGGLTDKEARFSFTLNAIDHYLLESTIVQVLSESMAIPPHIMMPLLLKFISHPSLATGRAIDVFLNEVFINSDPETTWTEVELNDPFILGIRLHKIKLLMNGLKLKLEDIGFLMDPASVSVGFPNFNALPVQQTATVDGINKWISLFNLSILNEEVFNEENSVFDLSSSIKNNTVTKELLLQKINEITGWRTEDLLYLTGTEGLNLTFPENYIDGTWLLRVEETLQLVTRTGATARQMASWASPNITKTQADSVRNAAAAKYGEEQWQEITVPLRHNIREVQRDALVQYVLHYCTKHSGSKFDDIDDIYGYYLIDTQMAACTDTSRIVLASSSVQLFVQRIMMNLEPGMSLNREFMKEWKWRKYYRVWEANRKVFMWPENWIEPELRDDKTPLFKELENDLMQSELSAENVERAYVSYLEKLHEISHLKVVGMYKDAENLHVIGQTSGIPESYYYRRWESEFKWSPWEKIELDIFNGEEIDTVDRGILLTVVAHNRSLFLFWPLFKIKKEPPTAIDQSVINDTKNANYFNQSIVEDHERAIDKLVARIKNLQTLYDRFEKVVGEYTGNLGELKQMFDEKIGELEIEIQGHQKTIIDYKGFIRINEEDIRALEQGHQRYQVSLAWSQYRDGHWTPKKVSQQYIATPLFVDDVLS